MKRLIFISGILLLLSEIGNSQQLPLYSQYLMNGFLLNPAIAGSVNYIPVQLTARSQWVGIEDAPQTFAISAHTGLSNGKMGAGGYIYTDMFGPITRTGLLGAYAYHLQFAGTESKLALGLSASAFQYQLDETDLNLLDEDDQAISYGKETTFAPDATFGAYFYNPKYYIGFSAAQLFQFNVGINDNNKNRMIRHYFLMGGYIFKIGEKFDIEPSLLLKGTEKTPFQVDVNVKAYYMKSIWLGFSYRTSKDAICVLGLKITPFYFGYAFDYTFSPIQNYSKYGSHELMLGVNIGEGKSTGSTLF
ncbi:MAG: type IX secretion system membrane protein PorP/SprF [Bacteroidia bacterium]|nr:type IX secretion system membrane protein PorP/SprF [Bacteroidia bacterium]